MKPLIVEIILRLAKAGLAAIIGVVIYLAATGPGAAAPGPELALLSWLGGAAFVLLVESSPI
jgi:hypothetical protein